MKLKAGMCISKEDATKEEKVMKEEKCGYLDNYIRGIVHDYISDIGDLTSEGCKIRLTSNAYHSINSVLQVVATLTIFSLLS